jgi:hypothetical protein
VTIAPAGVLGVPPGFVAGSTPVMRHKPVPLRLALLTASFALTCGAAAAAAEPPVVKSVTFGGVTVRVPAEWPVYDLAAAPHTCIRYDRPAVYLGHPGIDQDCPASAVGRTEAVLIEPEDPGSMPAADGARERGAVSDTEQALTRRLGGVRLSVSYADDDTRAAAILGSARRAEGGAQERRAPADDTRLIQPTAPAATPGSAAEPEPTAESHKQPDTIRPPKLEPHKQPDTIRPPKLEPVAMFAGAGFDTCAAPSLTTMGVWATKSPFKAAGVYIGGSDRACPDGNLTPNWIRQAGQQGWTLFPIYVGRQAPCWKDPGGGAGAALIQHGRRWTQGVEAADDAANRAAYFGLSPASAIYFDMEYYPRTVPGCTEDVLAFLSAWTDQLHKRGFLSGVYSSASGAIADLVTVYDAKPAYRPDVAWFAHWDAKAALFGDPTLSDRYWPGHSRIKQYTGGHNATYGGVKVNIDTDLLDAPVAGVK